MPHVTQHKKREYGFITKEISHLSDVDLTPLDLPLWGYARDHVYADN